MTITWFRCYHEIIDDPKIGMMSDTDQLLWFKLLCLASADNRRGSVTLTDDEIAFKLRCSSETWQHAKDKFRGKGLIEHRENAITITNWEKRQSYQKPSDKPEATKERKRRQRAKRAEAQSVNENPYVTPVTPLSRVVHATDTDTDPNSDSDSDPKKDFLDPLSPSPTPQMQNAERESKSAALSKKENTKTHNPLSQLDPETKKAFLKFCVQHYETSNPGKHLSLPQEYARRYFDDLWELFQNSSAPKANLEPSIKNEETAIAICENFPVEEWPQWIVKFIPHTGEYYKRFEAFMMQPQK